MIKELHFGDEARKEIAKGVQKLTDAVKVTMGPMGRNVLIHREGSRPFLTKDGVTVAQEVFLKDKLQDIGAQIIKEVSANTAFEAGDGTTTSTVLVNAIYQRGLEMLEGGADPILLKKGMDSMVQQIITILTDHSRKIKDEDIYNVATISANGDTNIGQLIADAIKGVGREGIITVEENSGVTDELILSEGLELKRGYLSPHFVTNKERDRVELENPVILVTDVRISALFSILPILEKVQKLQRPLLIIAEDIEGEALSSIIVNKQRGILDVTAIKAPGFGAIKEEMLKDIALMTGATLISSETGATLENIQETDLGESKRIIVNKSTTVIIEGLGDKNIIDVSVESLKAQIESQDDGELKSQLKTRLSRLTGGAAVIRVGAQTEFEMSEKKDRFDDAVEATKSAIAEGIVIGGGCAFLQAVLEITKNDSFGEKDFILGQEIILETVSAPFRQILENAGVDDEEVINLIDKLREKHEDGEHEIGYNVVSQSLENLFETGVIDPLKVERIALINANSIASTLLTTEVAIFEESANSPKD